MYSLLSLQRRKKIKKLHTKQQRLILQILRDLEINPDDLDFYQLKGSPERRLRLGAWRMLFRDKGKVVMVALTLKSISYYPIVEQLHGLLQF
jgi:mRNA-degrading endonuclease RelE of RelBE toxin-antitoxin system